MGATTVSGYEMVNYANSYFVNIAANLTNGILNNDHYDHLTEPNLNSFQFLPTDVFEVSSILRILKNKGNVVNDLSVVCLKNNIHIFSDHLSYLYNFSIEKMVFPNQLKTATAILGHKSGPKDQIDNYRPISNLSIFLKVF